jgi:hypothetical protein
MKIRNVKNSLWVLTGLIFLSLAFYVSAQEKSLSIGNIFLDSDQDRLSDAEEKSLGTDPRNPDTDGDSYSDGIEVESGYDPLKPAPGDKLIEEIAATAPIVTIDPDEKNSTQLISQKIVALSNEKSSSGEMITQADIQTLVDESLLSNATKETVLPEINREDLNIKKQDYAKYSAAKATAKRKEDFSNYITGVFYILSSNSPRPITSETSLDNVFNSLFQEIIQALTLRDTSSLEKLNASGEKIQEQMLEIEVPEELADIHIQILQLAKFSQEMEYLINPIVEDPVADMANLSQLAGLATSFLSFTSEVEAKFSEYGLVYDENLQEKIQDLGLEIPQDLQAELEKNQTAE